MRIKGSAPTITADSPDEASTVVHDEVFKGALFSNADLLVIDAALNAGTNGALDVYLQRKLDDNDWVDWVHFPQVAADGAAAYTIVVDGKGGSLDAVGRGTDASPNVILAASKVINTLPGGDVRVVFVAGAGTSAGGSNTITITPYWSRH